MSYQDDGGYPTLAEIRAWIKIAATSVPDSELEVIAAAEQAAQAHLDWGAGELPANVLAAFYRRCSRAVAAKPIPLGIIAADAEYGTIRIGRYESEIERYEAPYVAPVIA